MHTVTDFTETQSTSNAICHSTNNSEITT